MFHSFAAVSLFPIMNDRYQIISTLASGGTGSILQAWDKSQNRDVAIKRLHTNTANKDSLLREARALYALRHPGIVTVLEYGDDEDGAYLVMELIKGETLDHRLIHGPLDIPSFKALVTQTLEAISAAHDAGLIHRDLKPENIMLPWNRDGHFEIRLIDFGLSQMLPPEGASQDSMQGSVHYMAPEQFGSGRVDVRTDLYALGCIYYQALSGQLPFPGEEKIQVITAHLYPPKVPLAELRPDLSDELCAWVEQLMCVQPAGRPASAAQALASFRKIARNLQIHTASAIEPEISAVMILEEEEMPAVLSVAEDEEEEEAVLLADPEATQEIEVPDAEEEAPVTQAGPEVTQQISAADFTEEEPPAMLASAQPHPARVATDTPTTRRPPIPAPSRPRPKRKLGLQLIISAFVGIVVLQFAIVSYFKFAGREERDQRFAQLTASEHPQGSDLDTKLLLDYLEPSATRDQAAQTLTRLTGGSYIDELILERLQTMKGYSSAARMVEIIGQRRSPGAFPQVLPLAEDSRGEVRQAAWSALSRITPATELPKVLDLALRSPIRDGEMIENILVAAIEGADDRPLATSQALKAYRTTQKEEHRVMLFNVLTRVGGEGVVELVNEAIADPAQDVRLAAITVLSKYPTHEPLTAISARFPQEPDPNCRIYLLLAARELVSRPGPSSQQNLFLHAQSLYSNANGSDEKSYVLKIFSRLIAPGTASFFESFQDETDRKLTREARELGQAFRTRLSRVVPVAPGNDATSLPAEKADYRHDGTLALDKDVLINWTQSDDWASWLVEVPANGTYEIAIYQAHDSDQLGSYEVLLAGQTLLTTAVNTGSKTDYKGFVVGTVKVEQPGIYRLQVRPKSMPAEGELFRLQRLAIKAL
jgi:serine/threonine protein kinase